MPRLNSKGFTLLETLMAASILIVVSIALANVFGVTLHRLNAGSDSLADSNSAELTFARIEKDLHNMIAFSPFPFTGSSDSMTFPVLLRVEGPDDVVTVRHTLVSYNYNQSVQGQLVRKAFPFGVAGSDSMVVFKRRDSGVLKYGSVNTDGTLGWSDNWIATDSSAVPYAVKIRMVPSRKTETFAASHDLEREILLRLDAKGRDEN